MRISSNTYLDKAINALTIAKTLIKKDETIACIHRAKEAIAQAEVLLEKE